MLPRERDALDEQGVSGLLAGGAVAPLPFSPSYPYFLHFLYYFFLVLLYLLYFILNSFASLYYLVFVSVPTCKREIVYNEKYLYDKRIRMMRKTMIRNYTDNDNSNRDDNDDDVINNGSNDDNGDILIILTARTLVKIVIQEYNDE